MNKLNSIAWLLVAIVLIPLSVVLGAISSLTGGAVLLIWKFLIYISGDHTCKCKTDQSSEHDTAH